MTVVTDSNFRNKILMPILFEHATKLPTFRMPQSRKKMGSETTQRKKKKLFETVRDFYKRTDETNKQSIALADKNKQHYHSNTKEKDKMALSRSSQLFTSRKKAECSRSGRRTPEPEAKRYVTKIQKLQLINEIEMRRISKQPEYTQKQTKFQSLQIRRTNTNIFYLDFERDIPKLGDLRWLIEAEQINQERLDDIKKKLQSRGVKIRSLAERKEKQANQYIKRYMEMIDVDGIDQKHVATTQELQIKYKEMDGFLDELKKKQKQRDQRFKTISQSVKSIDGRLNENKYTHAIPEIEVLMRRTSQYQVWKDIANRDIKEDIKGLVDVLKTNEETTSKQNIVLELLRQSRMDKNIMRKAERGIKSTTKAASTTLQFD